MLKVGDVIYLVDMMKKPVIRTELVRLTQKLAVLENQGTRIRRDPDDEGVYPIYGGDHGYRVIGAMEANNDLDTEWERSLLRKAERRKLMETKNRLARYCKWIQVGWGANLTDQQISDLESAMTSIIGELPD
jgi:hypothetical protein